MSPVSGEKVEKIRAEILSVLGKSASDPFLKRIDAILAEWAEGKLTAAQACEKVQKIVSLFIGEEKAREIGSRCSLIVMRESLTERK